MLIELAAIAKVSFLLFARVVLSTYDKPSLSRHRERRLINYHRPHFILSIIRRRSDRFILAINCGLVEERVCNHVGLVND